MVVLQDFGGLSPGIVLRAVSPYCVASADEVCGGVDCISHWLAQGFESAGLKRLRSD